MFFNFAWTKVSSQKITSSVTISHENYWQCFALVLTGLSCLVLDNTEKQCIVFCGMENECQRKTIN